MPPVASPVRHSCARWGEREGGRGEVQPVQRRGGCGDTPDTHNAHVLAWFKHLGAADVLNGVLDYAGIESSGCLASATCTQDGVLHRTSSASSAMLAACTCVRGLAATVRC